jgi:hypothetical protein
MSLDDPNTKPQPLATLQVSVPTLTPAASAGAANANAESAAIAAAVKIFNFLIRHSSVSMETLATLA